MSSDSSSVPTRAHLSSSKRARTEEVEQAPSYIVLNVGGRRFATTTSTATNGRGIVTGFQRVHNFSNFVRLRDGGFPRGEELDERDSDDDEQYEMEYVISMNPPPNPPP